MSAVAMQQTPQAPDFAQMYALPDLCMTGTCAHAFLARAGPRWTTEHSHVLRSIGNVNQADLCPSITRTAAPPQARGVRFTRPSVLSFMITSKLPDEQRVAHQLIRAGYNASFASTGSLRDLAQVAMVYCDALVFRFALSALSARFRGNVLHSHIFLDIGNRAYDLNRDDTRSVHCPNHIVDRTLFVDAEMYYDSVRWGVPNPVCLVPGDLLRLRGGHIRRLALHMPISRFIQRPIQSLRLTDYILRVIIECCRRTTMLRDTLLAQTGSVLWHQSGLVQFIVDYAFSESELAQTRQLCMDALMMRGNKRRLEAE